MIKQVFSGLSAYLRVPAATVRHGLLRYHIATGLLSLLLGILLVYGGWSLGDDLGHRLTDLLPWSDNTIVSGVGEWVGRLALLLLGLILYKHLVLICVAPIMSPLSERIEQSLGQLPVDKPLSLGQWAKDIVRGLRIALRNVVRELSMTMVLLLLSLVPGFALITTPLLFTVQAYYMGFGNMDYYMERHLDVKAAATYVRRRRWLAIMNGAIFLALLAIPFVGFLIAPAFGATAATLGIMDDPERPMSAGLDLNHM